jgi:CRISPR/Cas system-associated protein Cas7 (RAMP superfamily)
VLFGFPFAFEFAEQHESKRRITSLLQTLMSNKAGVFGAAFEDFVLKH